MVVAFDDHAAALHGFASASVRDADLAEDLVQEAFLRLVRELRAGRDVDNVRAWLFRVCANLAASHGRRASIRERFRFRLVDRSAGPSPEDAVVRRDNNAQLRAALDRLRLEERTALLLSASGLSASEVGTSIGRTANATRAFICRSRVHLRELMTEKAADR